MILKKCYSYLYSIDNTYVIMCYHKAHFDNVPSDYKVVDGARSKWSNLLILDGFIYLLNFDEFNSASRRAFNQHQVLHRCILDEFKRRNDEVVWNSISNENLSDELIYNMIVVENRLFPWNNLQELRNYLLIDPTAKSRGKYLNIIDSLFDHVTLLKYEYDLPQIIMHVIVKSLLSFKDAGVNSADYGMHKSIKHGAKKRDNHNNNNNNNSNISKNRNSKGIDYAHKITESLSSSSTSSQDTTACINSILRDHKVANQRRYNFDDNDYNNISSNDTIVNYDNINNNNSIVEEGFMTLKQLVDQQPRYLQQDNHCSIIQRTSTNDGMDHISELSIFNNSRSTSLDRPSTCSLTIDINDVLQCRDEDRNKNGLTTDNTDSCIGKPNNINNNNNDRYTFDPHVFDDSDDLTINDCDGVSIDGGRQEGNEEELGSPWDLLDDWALITHSVPLKNGCIEESSTITDKSSTTQGQHWYDNDNQDRRQSSNHHRNNNAIDINQNNHFHRPSKNHRANDSICDCSSMVPFPIDISSDCKAHSYFAKRTEFATAGQRLPTIHHSLKPAGSLKRGRPRNSGMVKINKDGSIAKKIGRPPKKNTIFVNKMNNRINSYRDGNLNHYSANIFNNDNENGGYIAQMNNEIANTVDKLINEF